MYRLSIVVPVQSGGFAEFEDTLASVLRNRPARTQVIVVHDGAYPDCHDLPSMGVQIVRVAGAISFGELCFAALSHCTAPVVHWLRPGVAVDEGWCESPLDQFQNPQVASVTPLLVTEKFPDRILTVGITCGSSYRVKLVGTGSRLQTQSRWFPMGPSAWAAFYRVSSLRTVVGPLTPLVSDNGDLEIALSFRAVGWLNVVDVNSIISMETSEQLVRDYQAIRGSQTQRILWRHHPGTVAATLKTSLAAALSELIAGLVSPRRGWHGWQRLWATIPFGRSAHRRETMQALQRIKDKLDSSPERAGAATRTAA